jgi:hypothetical protein
MALEQPTTRFTPFHGDVWHDGATWGWKCSCGGRDGGYITHGRAAYGLALHKRRTGHGGG